MQGHFIQLEGTVNTRDLGGFETKSGKKVKPERLVRSEHFANITKKDEYNLRMRFSPATIVDFRALQETRYETDILFPGSTYIHLPILRDRGELTDAYAAENISFGDRMAMAIAAMDNDVITSTLEMYDTMMHDFFTVNQYRHFFDLLLNQEKGAVIWHCSAGKDRTGIAAALILLALGADPDAVREDYLMSNTFLAERTDEFVNAAASDGVDAKICEELRKWCSVFPEYFDTAMNSVRRNWGNMDRFLYHGMGLTAAKREKLAELYLE